MNYYIPLKNNEFEVIANDIKPKKNQHISYGFSEMDFVLKSQSNEDIVIESDILAYKEKMLISFPQT